VFPYTSKADEGEVVAQIHAAKADRNGVFASSGTRTVALRSQFLAARNKAAARSARTDPLPITSWLNPD